MANGQTSYIPPWMQGNQQMLYADPWAIALQRGLQTFLAIQQQRQAEAAELEQLTRQEAGKEKQRAHEINLEKLRQSAPPPNVLSQLGLMQRYAPSGYTNLDMFKQQASPYAQYKSPIGLAAETNLPKTYFKQPAAGGGAGGGTPLDFRAMQYMTNKAKAETLQRYGYPVTEEDLIKAEEGGLSISTIAGAVNNSIRTIYGTPWTYNEKGEMIRYTEDQLQTLATSAARTTIKSIIELAKEFSPEEAGAEISEEEIKASMDEIRADIRKIPKENIGQRRARFAYWKRSGKTKDPEVYKAIDWAQLEKELNTL